jgi:hypothetical protein
VIFHKGTAARRMTPYRNVGVLRQAVARRPPAGCQCGGLDRDPQSLCYSIYLHDESREAARAYPAGPDRKCNSSRNGSNISVTGSDLRTKLRLSGGPGPPSKKPTGSCTGNRPRTGSSADRGKCGSARARPGERTSISPSRALGGHTSCCLRDIFSREQPIRTSN